MRVRFWRQDCIRPCGDGNVHAIDRHTVDELRGNKKILSVTGQVYKRFLTGAERNPFSSSGNIVKNIF